MIILIAVGAIALASVAGPHWAVRVGAIVGVAAGVVAAALAVRGFRALDRAHRQQRGQEVLDLERGHGEGLRQHRANDAEVATAIRGQIKIQDDANTDLRSRLDKAGETIVEQRTALDELSAERTGLRRELAIKDDTIADLRGTLETRDEELSALLGDVDAAEIYTLPRRRRSAERAAAPETNDLVELAPITSTQPNTATQPATEELRREA